MDKIKQIDSNDLKWILMKRLYDKGINENTMPSVKRPFGNRPVSVKFNPPCGEGSKRNSNQLKNKETLQSFDKQGLPVLYRPSTTSHFIPIPKMQMTSAFQSKDYKKGSNKFISITGINTENPLPPSKKKISQKFRLSLIRQGQSQHLIHPKEPIIQPQVKLEKNLIYQRPVRTAKDFRLEENAIRMLGAKPIVIEKRITEKVEEAKKKNNEIPKLSTRQIFSSKSGKQEEVNDIDQLILLIFNMSEDNGEFVYLIQRENSHPYDLLKTPYKKIQNDNLNKYYTLSKQGVTMYRNYEPIEFISLSDWISERDKYHELSTVNFFCMFRKWKAVKVWRKNVIHQKRKVISNSLKEKVLQLDPTLNGILSNHKSTLYDMEKFKLFEFGNPYDPPKTKALKHIMIENAKDVEKKIASISAKSKKLFMKGVNDIMDNLKKEIHKNLAKGDDNPFQDEYDEKKPLQQNENQGEESNENKKRLKLKTAQASREYKGILSNAKTKNKVMIAKNEFNMFEPKKILGVDIPFENLGFPSKITYSHRSVIRKKCSKFIRFSYLLDFYTVESLQNLFKNSFSLFIKRLQILNQIELPISSDGTIIKPDISNIELGASKPIVLMNLQFIPYKIEKEKMKKIQISAFSPGNLEVNDSNFDPSCHIVVTKEDIVYVDKYYLDNLWDLWIKIEPTRAKLRKVLLKGISIGKECLKKFGRFSKHKDLTPYVEVLEDWDDKVADNWEPIENDEIDCEELLKNNEDYSHPELILDQCLDNAFQKCVSIQKMIQPFMEIYCQYAFEDWEKLTKENIKFPKEIIKLILEQLQNYAVKFKTELQSFIEVGVAKMDFSGIRKLFEPLPKQWKKKIEEMLGPYLRLQTAQMKNWITLNNEEISIKVDSIDSYIKRIKSSKYVRENLISNQEKAEMILAMLQCCRENQLNISKDDSERDIQGLFKNLKRTLNEVEDNNEKRKEEFKLELTKHITELNEKSQKLLEEVHNPLYENIESGIESMQLFVNKIESEYQLLNATAKKCIDAQETLDLGDISFTHLDEGQIEVEMRVSLWRSLKEWTQLMSVWGIQIFETIDRDVIISEADKYWKKVLRCEGHFGSKSSAVNELKKQIDCFRQAMPVVLSLKNNDLQGYHWEEIKELIKADFDLEEKQFTLNQLIESNVGQFKDEIELISTCATQEKNLNKELEDIDQEWKSKKVFRFLNYKDMKDCLILSNLDELIPEVEETLTNLNRILSSRFIKRLQKKSTELKVLMDQILEILEEWINCQRNWIYLENLFTPKDIRLELAKESKDFDQIDKQWKALMRSAHSHPFVFNNIIKKNQKTLKDCNKKMDYILKKLEEFLEKKRQQFNRFYFLANDEVLQILAHSQELETVEHYLLKMFDNISKLDYNGTIPIYDILGMESCENEKVKFDSVIRLKNEGAIQWLLDVENQMFKTLKNLIKLAHVDNAIYEDRRQWILKHIGQAISSISQVLWTESCEVSILDMNDNPNSLIELYESSVNQIKELIKLVREDITPLKRKIVVALITSEVHGRDIIEQITEENVSSIKDFKWIKNLRYYPEGNDALELIKVNQINHTILYGYEYMGATSRLVVTPLTDRCWITITSALNIHLGAAPSGPAGTGKTESTKDLAKAIGLQCVVFNCSEQVDYKMTERIFSGLASQGCWSCLDEFNRIDIEVLSVIAQQVLEIKVELDNKHESGKSFSFQGKEIALKNTCGIFVTMNPTYAGRTELPDNLKSLFRPVAMMIPDYGLIAEIMLFAEGFDTATQLSRKIVKLYKLASEQLSQQCHYDFGMRAVKSILVQAGALKRKELDVPEDILLIRAMKDSNLPKFVNQDIPLFIQIVEDLFPQVVIPEINYGILADQIKESGISLNLQITEEVSKKCLQLYDIINLRFGVMIVGPPSSGKTTIYKLLKNSFSELRKKNVEDPKFQIIEDYAINPKSISIGELFGNENEDTKEWVDGIASEIFRRASIHSNENFQWIVFDGPVDPLWIENLNTVLDDNMMLCLANGQRIKLRNEMRIFFELDDLSSASPATISRCGIVYLNSIKNIGYLYYKSWINNFFSNSTPILNSVREIFREYLEEAIDKGFKYLGKGREMECLQTSDAQVITNFCTCLSYLMTPEFGIKETEFLDYFKRKVVGYSLYAFIWAFGGSLLTKGHLQFDDVARTAFNKISIPMSGTLFDYYFPLEPQEVQIKPWKELISKFEYDSNVPFYSIFVPTTESNKFSTILKLLISMKRPIFITGESGSGKTALIEHTISKLKNIMKIGINFSAHTSSLFTQQTIESKLEKKKGRKILGPIGQKLCALFIDDCNMPVKEKFGDQPPIELLRQLITYKGLYNRPKFFWKDIIDLSIICAAAPPGGGRNVLPKRFLSQFQIIHFPVPSDDNLKCVYNGIVMGYYTIHPFADSIKKTCLSAVQASIELLNNVSKLLLPIPSKFYYVYNLRDLSHLIQALISIDPSGINNLETYCRFWAHESFRVIGDRINNSNDLDILKKSITLFSNKELRMEWAVEDLFGPKILLFSDILTINMEEPVYKMVADYDKVKIALERILIEYSVDLKSKLDMVMFIDAIQYTCKLMRILRFERGNILILGVCGSGRQSLIKLSTYIRKYTLYQLRQLKLSKGITYKDDIKQVLHESGVKGKKVAFLITDNVLHNDNLLEDLNNLMNSGEVSNLYTNEEIDALLNEMEPYFAKIKTAETRDQKYSVFIQRILQNVHIIIASTPIGDILRSECRMFPSLLNCTSIVYVDKWPDSALLSVAEKILSDQNIIEVKMQPKIAEMIAKCHTSIEESALILYEEQKRKIYVTPKNYLDSINFFSSSVLEIQKQNKDRIFRLEKGIQNLKNSEKQVEKLKLLVLRLQPELNDKTKKAQEAREKNESEAKKRAIEEKALEREASLVDHQAIELKYVREEAQKELDQVTPAVEAAKSGLKNVSKDDITEMKTYQIPPEAIQMVMQAVLLIMGSDNTEWNAAKVMLSDMKFLDKLLSKKIEEIPENTIIKLKGILAKEDFNLDKIEKKVKSAKNIAQWCIAVNSYYHAYKNYKPKKDNLMKIEAKYNLAVNALNTKKQQLETLNAEMKVAEEQRNQIIKKVEELTEENEKAQRQISNAEKLVVLLKDESIRWEQMIKDMKMKEVEIIGNVFLSAISISYLGPFPGSFRNNLLESWKDECKKRRIKCSQNYSLIETIGDKMEIEDWTMKGLPKDVVSIENGLISMKCNRWPLMIDPQGQANNWIRLIESKNKNFKTLKVSTDDYIKVFETGLSVGAHILLEDIQEEMDYSLESILGKKTYIKENIKQIQVNGHELFYDDHFMLYITTKISNPHFLPDFSVLINLVNFAVTFEGLKDQLLVEVLMIENQEIENKRLKTVYELSSSKNELIHLEEKILKLLSEADPNTILDNEELILALETSKVRSKELVIRMEEIKKVEAEITISRNQYKEVSERGALTFFVIMDLPKIDPMYQYSLNYCTKKFIEGIKLANPSNMILERVRNLTHQVTIHLFKNICLGLFEKHKIIFSFRIAIAILQHANQISNKSWQIFLRGASIVKVKMPPSSSSPISKAKDFKCDWDLLNALQIAIPEEFGDISNLIANNSLLWENYANSENLLNAKLPYGYQSKISHFGRLLLIKALKPEKLFYSCKNFVEFNLGKEYVQFSGSNIEDVMKLSDSKTPIIFILAPGTDPTGSLIKYFKSINQIDKLKVLALGKGQEQKAENITFHSKNDGNIVLFQNCHLMKSFMPRIEFLMRSFESSENPINDNFRFILTSLPVDYFPINVLQNGLKVSTENPAGLRPNLIRLINQNPKEQLNSQIGKPGVWKKLLFGLSMFHSIIQERKKFGPLGWNISYEFNDADFDSSISLMYQLVDTQDNIPWESIVYLVGHISYGGRVTDDNDRNLLICNLHRTINPDVVGAPKYSFSTGGKYLCPSENEDFINYIGSFPQEDPPELFEMHSNANIVYLKKQADYLIEYLQIMQPKSEGSKSANLHDEEVGQVIILIKDNLPTRLNIDGRSEKHKPAENSDIIPSLSIVLIQESERYNSLIIVLSQYLLELSKAIKGEILMSQQLEEIYHAFLLNQIPENWKGQSYPSLKSLSSWIKDLNSRCEFFRTWLSEGEINSFWLNTFTFPQGLITAMFQTVARRKKIAIDKFNMLFFVTNVYDPAKIEKGLEESFFVHGLYMQAGSWSDELRMIVDQKPFEMIHQMPIISFIPSIESINMGAKYICPIYKISTRAGVLSSTGHSTNFIIGMTLPCEEKSAKWTLRGTAIICSSDI